MKCVVHFALCAVVIAAVMQALMAATPNCSPKVYPLNVEGSLDWWQKTPLYQIYPLSFLDSNGDGYGDLKGIESHLSYLKTIGIDVVWICPFFSSPMKAFGYDIKDYCAIEPLFGDMNDFDSLMKIAKEQGIKILLDLVPNHSSNEHDWFNKSRHRIEPYTDYYVWKDGKGPDKKEPPNNWISMNGGSAWTYDELRGQFYFHQFIPELPDLNYRNPTVWKEMENVFRFWLDKGVDGFRIDAFHTLFEDQQFRDEPRSQDPNAKPNEYGYLSHIYTTNLPECVDILAEWRRILQSYQAKDNHHRMMILEAMAPKLAQLMKYYGNSTHPLADFTLNFQLNGLHRYSTAFDAVHLMTEWLDAITPIGKWSNWLLGSHDISRMSTRVHPELQDGLNMLSLTLPGTSTTYYGEEIGMEDIHEPSKNIHNSNRITARDDRYNDPNRSPMQWNQNKNAGFSSAEKTWKPVNSNYKTVNVETEWNADRSHLKVYKALAQLRNEPTLQKGSVQFPLVTESISTTLRLLNNNPAYVTVINWSNKQQKVDFRQACVSGFQFPEKGTVVISSTNIPEDSPLIMPSQVSLTDLVLGPYQSLVIQFTPI